MKSKKTNIERVPYSSKNAVPGKVVYITIVGPPRKRRNETREDGVYHMRTNGKKSKKENSWYWYKKEGKETEPPPKRKKKWERGLMRAGLLDSIASVSPTPILRSHSHRHHPSPQVQPTPSAACCKSRRRACNRPVKRRASESFCR